MLAERITLHPPAHDAPPTPESLRFSVEGHASALRARVVRRREGAVTLAAALPALSVGARVVDAEGRAGRVARVALAIDRDVPSMVVELAYDAAPPRRRARDETIGYEEQRPEPAAPRESGWVKKQPRERESTQLVATIPPSAGDPEPPRQMEPWMHGGGSELSLRAHDVYLRLAACARIVATALRDIVSALRR